MIDSKTGAPVEPAAWQTVAQPGGAATTTDGSRPDIAVTTVAVVKCGLTIATGLFLGAFLGLIGLLFTGGIMVC